LPQEYFPSAVRKIFILQEKNLEAINKSFFTNSRDFLLGIRNFLASVKILREHGLLSSLQEFLKLTEKTGGIVWKISDFKFWSG